MVDLYFEFLSKVLFMFFPSVGLGKEIGKKKNPISETHKFYEYGGKNKQTIIPPKR